MAKGLHPTYMPEEIIKELQGKGLAIIEATNIIKKRKKEDKVIRTSLPLFMLVFDKKEDIKKIYDIKSILDIVVKIEPFRKTSPLIPQCKRCQGFSHTQRFCQLEPRCVRCAGKHHTRKCRKDKDSSPLCVNCHENHLANYRGCIVAKTLQKRRNNSLRQKTKGEY